MNKKLIAKITISFVIAALLFSFISKFLDYQRVGAILRQVSFKWLGMSFAAFLVYQWFRGLRFQLLVNLSGQNGKFFNTQCMHAFLNNTLPGGLDELSLVYLLKRFHEVTFHYGAASLLVARFIDLALFSSLFVILIVFSWQLLTKPLIIVMTGVIGMLIIAAITVRALFYYEKTQKLKDGILGKLHHHIASFSSAMRDVLSRGGYVKVILYSAAMWIAIFLHFLTAIWALGFQLSWFTVLLLYLMLLPIQLLPVKGVANFGTHELPWFVALQLLGLNASDAAVLGFGTHILFLIIVFMTALIPVMNYVVRPLYKRIA
jgi:uncharacterized protein (TIRG00374 family)